MRTNPPIDSRPTRWIKDKLFYGDPYGTYINTIFFKNFFKKNEFFSNGAMRPGVLGMLPSL